MLQTFDGVWVEIIERLKPGQVIQNWGAKQGLSEKKFLIINVNQNSIIVQPRSSKKNRTIPRNDFERVWNEWQGYLDGRFSRHKFRDNNIYHSSYIISIYHWMDL
jgi:hypothetical protein